VSELRRLLPGDPGPWFTQRSSSNPRYVFDTTAGRYVLLAFLGSAGRDPGRAAAARLQALSDLFDDARLCAFAVSADPEDESQARLQARLPGLRVLWDFDRSAARLYGAAPIEGEAGDRPLWCLLDPMLRVAAVTPPPIADADYAAFRALLEALPPPDLHGGGTTHAPVLSLPRVFEPELCQALIGHYETRGGTESGFMRELGGKTVLVTDPGHKRRKDCDIADPQLVAAARERVARRIVPEIRKAFQYQVTRLERDIVACYEADTAGHFRPHRDNTTMGTAHRRFAVSINLNDEFEGGLLSFPEFGAAAYKPPPGGAVVFSCSLLHTVSPVTSGRRYAYLPFLYDEAAARLREQNSVHLAEGAGGYKA
jgi:peroxiredoxin